MRALQHPAMPAIMVRTQPFTVFGPAFPAVLAGRCVAAGGSGEGSARTQKAIDKLELSALVRGGEAGWGSCGGLLTMLPRRQSRG